MYKSTKQNIILKNKFKVSQDLYTENYRIAESN